LTTFGHPGLVAQALEKLRKEMIKQRHGTNQDIRFIVSLLFLIDIDPSYGKLLAKTL
jgi:hypothetical protein